MFKVNQIRNFKALTVCGLLVFVGNSLSSQTLDAVLKSPASFHRKRISVVGILRGEGPMFELFESSKDAVAMTARKSVYIVAPRGWSKKGPYDLRRARVTGVIDAKRHGAWGNPCAMTPEKIEVLSGPVAPWPDAVAIFRNERNTSIVLRFGVPPTDSEFRLNPKEYVDVSGWSRENKGSTPLRVESTDGSSLAETMIAVPWGGPYYDSINAASYYQINGTKVEPVLPSEAKKWGWRR
jgi:hypothetical protein